MTWGNAEPNGGILGAPLENCSKSPSFSAERDKPPFLYACHRPNTRCIPLSLLHNPAPFAHIIAPMHAMGYNSALRIPRSRGVSATRQDLAYDLRGIVRLHTCISPTERSRMAVRIKEFFEFLWLYFKGFRPVEFVRGNDRVSLHACGWRANGTGRMKRAKDAVAYLDAADAEQWKQIYCGLTPFLVSTKGNVKQIDGSPAKLFLANGRYQIQYKPEDARGRGKNGHTHKKRVYRSMLVAMAFLDFKKGDTAHEIHHVNGYRTDDRLANLLVLTHEDHIRIHNMGPCALSGTRDDALAMLASSAPLTASEAEGGRGRTRRRKADAESDQAQATNDAPASPAEERCEPESPKPKRRRGKRGGRRHKKTQAIAANATNANGEQNATLAAQSCIGSSSAADEAPDITVPANEGSGLPEAIGITKEHAAAAHDAGRIDTATAAKADSKSHVCPKESEATREHTCTEASQEEREHACAEAFQEESEHAHKSEEKKSRAHGVDETIDWAAARDALEEQLATYLAKSAPEPPASFPTNKQLNKNAKPVYKALKPFLSCPDAVAQFDTALSCIRAVVNAEHEWGATGPAPIQSLLGSLHQLLKEAVKRLALGDSVERACVEELLSEEVEKPAYEKTSTLRKLRQCLSIARAKEE